MRERRVTTGFIALASRITPAYAGKTEDNIIDPMGSEDHPRVCGKDQRTTLLLLCLTGSPPRMRERPGDVTEEEMADRITPAYAGKTKPFPRETLKQRDHPRVCGKDPRQQQAN